MIFQFPKATVTRVIDGDTFEATVDTGFRNTHSDTFRMMGLDAPEKRGPEKVEGLRVTEIIREKIEGKEVAIHTYYQDSFGRWLCDVFIEGENLGKWMLDNNLAE